MNANDDSIKSTAEKIIKVYKFTEAFTHQLNKTLPQVIIMRLN